MALSPMMQQYFSIKDKYKDSILFFRLGDFYEMFFDDALIVSKALELTLTGRDCGLDERAPMCGIPYHASETYIAKLIEQGFKVAICEQTTLPDKSKGIVERDVIRVVTPGTVMESSMLEEDKNNYLACIYLGDTNASVAWIDITTGEFKYSFLEPPLNSKINDIISRISPSEIICNGRMLEKSIELSIVKYGSVCPFSGFSDLAFEYDSALELVKNQLIKNKIDNITKNKENVCVLGALLEYLQLTQKRVLNHINETSKDENDKYMILDSCASKTLEITESLATGHKKGSLLHLINKTSTSMGARKLRSYLDKPLLNIKTINERQEAVEEFLNDIIRDKFINLLKNVADIDRLVGRLSYGNLTPRDCISLATSLNITQELKALLQNSCKASIFDVFNNDIKDLTNISNFIFSAIIENPPVNYKDGGMIKKGYDNELDKYLNIKNDVKSVLAKLEADEKEETGIKNLKIAYNRVFGYYIEVSKSQVGLVPYRYERKQTLTTGERYITSELKELEREILTAEESTLSREILLYCDILEELKKHIDDIKKASNAISSIDCLISFAIIAKSNNFTRPIMNDKIDKLKLLEARHPVVESLLKNENFVPNDTLLDKQDNKIMLITGPNMAGKSVYMRQVAIITILAHIGSFVPAKYAEVPLIDRVFTRVGASDDLSTNRSTFMVEMSEVSYILENITDNSLVLLDEIGRGTSTYDGLSIAWSIMEYLSENSKAKVLFSTHYHELTELEASLKGVKNYKLTIKEVNNTIIFLRKLLRGSANRSFGIEVAAMAGLPNNVITKAKEILKKLESADIARQSKMATSHQLSMYSNNDSTKEITDILKDINIDEVSPRTALDMLSDLKEKAEKNG